MTKQDYLKLAAAIKRVYGEQARYIVPMTVRTKQGAILELTNKLADVFAADNSRFDRDRFLEACGWVE